MMLAVLLGVSFLMLPNTEAMSILVEPANLVSPQEDPESRYLEKLADLRKSLIEKMRSMANLVEYIDSYSKSRLKIGNDRLERIEPVGELGEPFAISKIDIWQEDDVGGKDSHLDVLKNILEASLHGRMKRSPRVKKGKRSGEDTTEEARTGEEDAAAEGDEKKKKKGRRARRNRKKSRS